MEQAMTRDTRRQAIKNIASGLREFENPTGEQGTLPSLQESA